MRNLSTLDAGASSRKFGSSLHVGSCTSFRRSIQDGSAVSFVCRRRVTFGDAVLLLFAGVLFGVVGMPYAVKDMDGFAWWI